MKKQEYKVYRVHVDLYRPTIGKYHVYQKNYPINELSSRPAEGMYFVKTLSESDASKLVREKIGKFGSIDWVGDYTDTMISNTVGPFKVDLTNFGQRRDMYLKDVLKPETVIKYNELFDIVDTFYGLKEENKK